MFFRCLMRLVLVMAAIEAHAASEPPAADLHMRTDLNRMAVQVEQGAPFPSGGCLADYTWHNTYGGCRRHEIVTESAPCPAGHSGSRTRQRSAYILQADARNIAHGPWEPWQDSCQRPRRAGVMDQLIVKVLGRGYAAPLPRGEAPSKNLKHQLTDWLFHGTRFGLTLDRASGKLRCAYGHHTIGGGESDYGHVVRSALLGPGQSMDLKWLGSCILSEGGAVASMYGNCNWTTGGEDQSCMDDRFTVRIIATTPCTVTTETRRKNFTVMRYPPVVTDYDICA